jgi:hypothetical protein
MPAEPGLTELQLWQRSLVRTAPEDAWQAQALPVKEDWLPWLALGNPDPGVLRMVRA